MRNRVSSEVEKEAGFSVSKMVDGMGMVVRALRSIITSADRMRALTRFKKAGTQSGRCERIVLPKFEINYKVGA